MNKELFIGNIYILYNIYIFLSNLLIFIFFLFYYIHIRDIKTTNVLLDDFWRCKLCDFSFAIHDTSNLKCNLTYGTEEFMSPEISLAQNFSFSTDIFSFGIVLCEIITGN
jgi:serine/threonine protein kinase